MGHVDSAAKPADKKAAMSAARHNDKSAEPSNKQDDMNTDAKRVHMGDSATGIQTKREHKDNSKGVVGSKDVVARPRIPLQK